jgi:hypothetical protein
VKKVFRLTTVLAAVLLLSTAAIQMMSAVVVTTSVDLDYVSNKATAAGVNSSVSSTITVSIADTDAGGTLPPARVKVTNLTTSTSTNVTSTQVSGANYTAVVHVTSSTTTPGTAFIRAVDGDHIEIRYTDSSGVVDPISTSNTRLAYVIVDATGPTVADQSPADLFDTKDDTPTLTANVSDAAAGMGGTPGVAPVSTEYAQVEANVTVIVAGSEKAGSATYNASGAVWGISRTPSITAGSNSWQVRAQDALGNETLTTAIAVVLDETVPTLASAATGVTLDAAGDARTVDATARKAIELVFDGGLDGGTIAPDGSDFRVENSVGSGALSIASAAHDADTTDLAKRVFITMTNDLAPGATPLISVIGVVTDKAGNANSAGLNVTATDGLKPTVTSATLVSAADSTLTNEKLSVRITSDESSADATATSDPASTTGVVVKSTHTDGTVFSTTTAEAASTFTTLATGTQWEWEYTFATDGTDDGRYNVYGAVLDFASGNSATVGSSTDSGATGAIKFEVDTGIPAPSINYSGDDPNTFIEIDYAGEATEYTGDSHGTVSNVTATVDDVAVTISSVDNIKFSIAAPDGGYAVGAHTVDVTATDDAGNTVTTADLAVTITERADISLDLRPGLNLVSIPGAPASAAINDVIASTHTAINQVFTYDPTKEGGWLVAERGNDGLFAGTLTTISSDLAYFVRSTSFEPLKVSVPRVRASAQTLPPMVSLSAGWNLVPVVDPTGDLAGGATILANTYFSTITEVRVYKIDDFGKLTVLDTGAAGDNVVVGDGYWVYTAAAATLIP